MVSTGTRAVFSTRTLIVAHTVLRVSTDTIV
jgi:hypothetical protein